jgi:hypothetical protein
LEGLDYKFQLAIVLGIKGVYYISSIQLLLDIWKNNKKAENGPYCCSCRIAGEYADIYWRIPRRIVLDRK